MKNRVLVFLMVLSLIIPSLGGNYMVYAEDSPSIPVMLYHRIVANPSNEWTDTSIDEFSKQMKYLADNGYTTLTAQQYVDIMEGIEKDIPEKPILLTFDDGTIDFKENALPILNQYNMNAILFIVTDWIDNPGNLTKDDLKQLSDLSTISLENHSKNHDGDVWGTDGSIRSNINEADAKDQIVTATKYLKDITGKDPVLMAYPYGSYNDAAKQVNKDSGIKYAFKVGYPNEENYVMGRHYVTDQNLAEFANMIDGPIPPNEQEEKVETIVLSQSFEEGQTGEWDKLPWTGEGTVEVSSDVASEGTKSLKFNRIDANSNPYLNLSNLVEFGDTYDISFKVRLSEGEDTLHLASKVDSASLDNIYPWLIGDKVVNSEEWTVFECSDYTVPTDTKEFLIWLEGGEGATTAAIYIDEVIIKSIITNSKEDDRADALPFTTITFENEELNGFEGRGGNETLTVTDEANHTEDGSYALKVEGREVEWNGPSLRIERYIDKYYEYNISVWVKLISPSISQIQLSTQIGDGDSASYNNLQGKTVSTEDGWVQLEGTYCYSSVGDEYVTIYVESTNNATASFYIDDISFEPTGSRMFEIQRDLTPIKEAYKDYFLIGNAVSAKEFDGKRLDLLTMHYNVVTAENAMKPSYAYGDYPEFDFTEEDVLVAQAKEAGLDVVGHVLVWHQQSEEALYIDEDGNPLDKEVALHNLKNHVKTVVEHFGDNVISWDVVNEAMNDNPSNPSDWRGALRESGWFQAIGPDYIKEAFLAAKEAMGDKDIKLYYNDYNDDNQNKAEAIYQMVKEINEEYVKEHDGDLLIDGIGMQGHYNLHTNSENVEASLKKFITVVDEVSITELDVTAGSEGILTEEQANKQAYLYANLFKIYKENSDHIARVTFWGLDDLTSWRTQQSPLIFDGNLQAKSAYYAIIDPDKYISEYVPEEKIVREGIALYGTPKIDGVVDEVWNDVPELPIDQYQMAWEGANGAAKALWDEENLYVLINVSDSQLDKSNDNTWEQDSIEVFLDQNNKKTTSYEQDDGQYRVNFDNETSFNPESIAEGFESATKVDGTNYLVEVKIPFTAITPVNGVQVGFDVQINDGQDGTRQSTAIWNDITGTGYMDTSIYGILTLKNSVDK